MSIRLIDLEKDHETLAAWWSARNWPVVPKHALPATGFIVEDVCAAFLYKTDSSICFMDWIIANPDTTKEARDQGLDSLINHCQQAAKEMNYQSILTLSSNHHFGDRLLKNEFQITDKDTCIYLRRI